MNDLVKGIVISVNDYKDNDAIINVITDTFDKVSLYVKGYKKISSKNVYATQLFDYSEFLFDYTQTKNINILKSAHLLNEFANIKSDYDKLCVGSFILECVNNLQEDNLFDCLYNYLKLLNDGNQPLLILNLFLADVLKMLGIGPFVDGCVCCDKQTDLVGISVDEGGFVCSSCNVEINSETRSVALLKKFRYINKASLEVIDKLYNLELNDFALTDILIEFLTQLSGMRFKSLKSLNIFKN